MSSAPGHQRMVDLGEASRMLALSEDGVRALAEAGYLAPADGAGEHFALGDVKAFLARVSDAGMVDDPFLADPDRVDPQALLDALDGRSDEMARRAFDIFQTVFPESSGWSIKEQVRFIEQARNRFEAILAVTSEGGDSALLDELEDVGAAAAWSGSSLPQLLVVLRISRDLVVQTAVELAEERGRHWGLALSLLLTRVLPAIDRLTDSIAKGYWDAIVGMEEESRARHENVVENASDGVYELDVAGHVMYANPALAVILGLELDALEGRHITEVLVPAEPTDDVAALTGADVRRVQLAIVRRDGVRRVVDVRAMPRYQADEVAGFQGVVRDVTAATELEAQKNEFMALITHDLRQPLTTILGLGATLESHATELPPDRVRRMGTSIRHQSERISRLADDLYDVSRIESQSLMLSPRPVDLAATVDAALGTVLDASDVRVRIEPGAMVQADSRRLEQVVANLVENAVVHGQAPVEVSARTTAAEVELVVTDHGLGVPEAVVPTLFSRLRTLSRSDRDPGRGTGLGLALVKGLVEAMGGRIWYERASTGGAAFHLVLPTPRSHVRSGR